MANKFEITISAVDRATAVVRRINASMSRLTAPVSRLRQSIRSLGSELGFDKVAKSIGRVGKISGEVVGKIGALAGSIGLLIGGGAVAAVIGITNEWANMGAEVARSAQGIDMSVVALQSLRGAAAVAGVGAQELTGGLKSLGDTMEDALYGRNQEALVILNRLGIGIHKTANGSIDAARGVRDLSASIAGIKNVQVQGVIARAFGLEAVLPLLRQGPAAIDAYERKVASLGGVMSEQAVAAAQDFRLQLNYLELATQGVRSAIGDKLLPIVQPLVARFTEWAAANRDLIATKVADFVEGLAHWVEQLDFKSIANDIHDFVGQVDHTVDSLGGWKNAALGVVLVMNAGLISSVINLGLALGKLAWVTVPAVIRVVRFMAALFRSSVVPAIAGIATSVSTGLASLAVFTAGLAEAAVGVPILGSVLGGLSIAFASASAAIAATPVGWLIAGIAAIAFGVYAIYKNWDKIGAYFTEKIGSVKAAFDQSWTGGVVKALWEFSPVKIVGDTLNGLSKWLFNFDLYGAGKSVVAGLVRGIKSVASLLPKSVLSLLGLQEWTASPAVNVTASAAVAGVSPAAVVAQSTAAVQTSAPRGTVPLGIRNNNPGNLRQWGDAPRDAKGYAVFPTVEDGLAATVKNLVAQQRVHGLNTIAGIIGKWAPPSENNTGAYVSDLAKRTGFGANQALNLDDPKVVAPLISGIVKHEGNGAGVSEEMINRAVAAQLGDGASAAAAKPQQLQVALTLHGLPAGVSASATSKDGATMPVRVSYSMPTGVTP